MKRCAITNVFTCINMTCGFVLQFFSVLKVGKSIITIKGGHFRETQNMTHKI